MARKLLNILLLFACLLLVYFLLRIGFYKLYFTGGSEALFRLFLWGSYLDYTSLFYVNLPFLVCYLFARNWKPAWLLFLILNLLFLAFNFIDLGYFAFTGRRSTKDLLYILPDSLGSLPAFFKQFWYLFLAYCLVALGLAWISKKILRRQAVARGKWQYGIAVVLLLVMAVFARGFGDRPNLPSTPLLYFEAEYQPLVTNSSFTLLYSLFKGQQQLKEKQYYSEGALDSLYSIRRQYVHTAPFQKKNVVIFILESYCREYLQDGSAYRAETPFLDSLIKQSTWCKQAYANGVMSAHGIVSILGSMPSFMHEPYYQSQYNSNKLRGIGTLLKEQGYRTDFFMGAGPDHFGFGKFSRMVGIDRYYSQKDFNNDEWYDGNWGIYDHRFLQYGAGVLQKESNPFLAVFFTISSHFPFSLPPDVGKQFDRKDEPAYLKTAAYVDYSLRQFFDTIKNTDWYKNTLFVFCADHSIMSALTNRYEVVESFRIPLFFHDPANAVGQVIHKPSQQTDVVPTILDYLNYPAPFMSFGRSVYDNVAPSYVAYEYRGLIEITDSSYVLGYNDVKDMPDHLYALADTARAHNLVNQPAYGGVQARLLQYSKAVLQQYNNSLIRNRLFVK